MSLCGKCIVWPCDACAVISDELQERGIKSFDSNLLSALRAHPQPWGPRDVAEIAFALDDGNDERNYTWVLRLTDGRWAAVRGWHDLTGWDCESGLKTEWYATQDDALRTFVDWERDVMPPVKP